MSIHPQVQAVLDKLAELGLPAVQSLTPVAARAQYAALVASRPVQPAAVASAEKRVIDGPGGGLSVNLYRPLQPLAAPAPLLVYYHGGGHVFGSPDTHDAVTRNLCAGVGCVVVSVDYRKAPEHPFPAAFDDALAALRWCRAHAAELAVDPTRLAVGGDSAGAQLAASVALALRDAGEAPCFQLLVYPIADYGCNSDSYRRYARGYGSLEAATMRWFQGHYLGDVANVADWRASPLRAASLAGLPPALLITAEYDVLHDEGADYARALQDAGVAVEHRDYPGMIHGFFNMAPMVDAADDAQAAAVAALRAAFSAGGTGTEP